MSQREIKYQDIKIGHVRHLSDIKDSVILLEVRVRPDSQDLSQFNAAISPSNRHNEDRRFYHFPPRYLRRSWPVRAQGNEKRMRFLRRRLRVRRHEL